MRCLLAGLLLLTYPCLLVGDEKPGADSVQKDYGSELPRIAAKTPAEALKTFKLQPGFRIELVAAEPLVQDPVSISFDENGRAYVTELPAYNRYDYKGFGRVRILEDTDGDGRLDRSTLFLDDVKYPTAVFAYDGGAFVADPPHVLYCKDTNGDDRADVRREVLTGFGLDHAGEAGLNSFRWGMDNRIHLSLSLASGKVRRSEEKNSPGVEVRGRGMVFDPRTEQFELTSGGGQHGMTLNDWGRKFVCSNSNPMQTLMYDGRYVARNPFFAPPSAAVTIAPEGKFTKIFRASTIEPWRTVRTRLRSKGIVRGGDEGGQPGGFFTAATGVTVYRGDVWPTSHRGTVLVGEVSNNLIFRAKLETNGLGLVAHRADKKGEFLTSSDNWFRPVQLANAPDGSLYVLDMYRELIEGAAFIPPLILKHLDVASGINRGRIYRIVPDDFQSPSGPKLGQADTGELVALLESNNSWHRDTASRLLYERQDKSAAGALRELSQTSKSPLGRAYALHSLNGLGLLTADDVIRGLEDDDANMRIQSLRLAEPFAAESEVVQAKMLALLSDDQPHVRYQLAFSLGAFHDAKRNVALVELLKRDGTDSWMRLAVQTSLTEGAGEVFVLLAADRPFTNSSHGRIFLLQLAEQIGTAGRAGDAILLRKSLQTIPANEQSLAEGIVHRALLKASPETKRSLNDGKVTELLRGLLGGARTKALDESTDLKRRTAAIRTLALSDYADSAELFAELLASHQPPEIQQAVLTVLARFDDPAVAELLLEVWRGLGPKTRPRATETLFARTSWLAAYLEAIEAAEVAANDLDPARIKQLRTHADKGIRSSAVKLFAAEKPSNRQEVFDAYRDALTLTGDAERGKKVFEKTCSTCHQVQGVGTQLGASLKSIKDRGNEAVLLNILDPNREVKPQFVGYVLLTTKGRAVTGLITDESANSVTLKRADGTSDTILRVDIEELSSTGLSFMPEGLEKQIDKQQMADLLAFLNRSE